MRGRVKLGTELNISCFDTMLNYWLSQKFKLLRNCEFNHFTMSLTAMTVFQMRIIRWYTVSQRDLYSNTFQTINKNSNIHQYNKTKITIWLSTSMAVQLDKKK